MKCEYEHLEVKVSWIALNISKDEPDLIATKCSHSHPDDDNLMLRLS